MIPGVDVSVNQPRDLPWAAWVAQGLKVCVVRLALPYVADGGGVVHLEQARDGGVPLRGAYADIYDHDAEVRHYDPARQARVFLDLLANHTPAGLVHFCMLDAEVAGLDPAEMTAWCDYFDAHCQLPLLIYGNMNLENICGVNNPRFSKYGVLVSDYGYVDLTVPVTAPPAQIAGRPHLPRIPRVGRMVGWQWGGDNSRWPPYVGAIDRSDWSDEWYAAMTNPTPVVVPNHIKLGPHHMQGGNATGQWLKLIPTVAKFVGDLGGSVEVQPGTLAMGRLVDDGMLDGQGFDVNRYIAQGADPVERAAAYIALLRPFIDSNPHIVVWEGPNEQIPESDDKAEAADPVVRMAYDTRRKDFMLWYADFAYAFAAGLHQLGRRAGIGSWASGTPRPEHDLWRFWGQALQATVDFGAVECRHDYAGIDVTGLLRCVYDNAEFEKLGFVGVPQVITELGADVNGTGWRQLFANDIGACFTQLIRPWLDQVAHLPWFLGATWYTDGGLGWENYDVSDTDIVAHLATYVAPPEDAMPITKAQQAQYLADLDTAKASLADAQFKVVDTRNRIAALVPDDAPANWWERLPAGVFPAPVAYPAQPKAYAIYNQSGAALGMSRTNGGQIFERQGDLLRVLATPISGLLWWVRAEELAALPAG